MQRLGWLTLAIVCSAIACARGQAPARLAAEVYPGALKLEGTGPADTSLSSRVRVPNGAQAFLTKDDPAKVALFYKGKSRSVAPGDVAWSQYFVTRVWTMGELGEEQAGVRVYDRAGEKGRECPILTELSHLAMLPPRSKADYDALVAKYGYLNRSYFTLSGKKDTNGVALDVEKSIWNDFQAQRTASSKQRSTSSEELSKKMQELIKAGKYEEAAALGRSMQQQAQSTVASQDTWPQLVALLDRLAPSAYRTLIIIEPYGGKG